MKAGERCRHWTSEEDAVVVRNAGKLDDKGIGRLVGRTWAATRSRRQILLGMSRKVQGWTAQEESILREHYGTAHPNELRTLLPGRSDKSIHHKLRSFDLRRRQPPISSGRVWSDEEDEALRRLYPENTCAAVASFFPGRTARAIERRAFKLGIQHSEKFWRYHYGTTISLGAYPAELQEVIRLGRKLKKAIHEYESNHR